MGNLVSKVALVTGVAAKKSMGHAVALSLAREGAKVILVDKTAKPNSPLSAGKQWGGLDEIVKEIKSIGSEALAVVADITNSQEIDSAISAAVKRFGSIDILVHCAAIRGPVGVPVIDLSEQDWKRLVDINLNGSFIVAKAVAKNMVASQKAGKIVLIASLGGIKGMAGSAGYSASKFGVIGLAKSLAMELAKYKINVNAINPGSVDTHLRDGLHEEMAKAEGISIDEARQKDYQKLISGTPLGRLAAPEEIADLVLYLVSDKASFITAEYFNITGGIS